MGHVILDRDNDHSVFDRYSQGTGPVLRSDKLEVIKIHFQKGHGTKEHQHPEEQVLYLLSGALEMTVDGETYVVRPGEASYHPPDRPHALHALEDSVGISFKNVVAPLYEATGTL